MFEFDEKIVESLLSQNTDFRRLYEKHGDLKERVREAHIGTSPLDDVTLENMKKEKLRLKDQMAAMIEDYRGTHTGVEQTPH
ncbi:MAG: YdcH family protein [Gammaproteobacteria bacterium]